MPPRIPSAARPLATASAPSCPSSQTQPFARAFTTTAPREKMSQRRRNMFRWLGGPQGRALADSANALGPNYIGPVPDQPFPLNPQFRSQPVLSEESRQMIYDKVTVKGESLKAVSAELGVDVRRVAAVVRLKAVEKQWQADVSSLPFLSDLRVGGVFCDETQYFRLVLKTTTWLLNAFYLSDCKTPPIFDTLRFTALLYVAC